jgi:D-cysteine desulfhydrase
VPVYGINVCDNAAYFQAKVREDIVHFQALNPQIAIELAAVGIAVIDGYVGEGYAKANKDVFACIQRVAQTEGVILDPVYSGKAFYGLLREIEKGRFTKEQDIIFVHTGGIFGLFAYEQALQDAVF